jgi:uncharacterized protein YndB with AHSA1/START domain
VTSLTLVRHIAARPSIVFDALISPEGITRWWGPDAGPVLLAQTDPRVGGRFNVRFRTLDGAEHVSTGEYLEVEPPQRLVMTWRWLEGGDDPGESRLAFELRPVSDGATELTLIHDRLQTDAGSASHKQGWTAALDKLERHFLMLARADGA